MMTYPPHTVDQQNGIGRKDHITLWDWLEFPKSVGYGLHFYPVKQKENNEPVGDKAKFPTLIQDRIIPNTRDIVPHNGMRSEQRAEYGIPVETEVYITGLHFEKFFVPHDTNINLFSLVYDEFVRYSAATDATNWNTNWKHWVHYVWIGK